MDVFLGNPLIKAGDHLQDAKGEICVGQMICDRNGYRAAYIMKVEFV